MDRLTFSLHGARCLLETDEPGFASFARRYLSRLEGPAPGAADRMDVVARIVWRSELDLDEPAEFRRVWGRRVIQVGSWLVQGDLPVPGLKAAGRWKGDQFELQAAYHPTSRWQHLAGRLSRHQERLPSALAYYLVFFPLVYFLERSRKWALLHAAAVALPGGGLLLSGLPGSGKTTFALGLLAGEGAQLVSDNLLLTDGSRVFACPEPLHLDAFGQALLPTVVQDSLHSIGQSVSYDRHDYHLPPHRLAGQARPNALLFLGRGGTLDCRRLNPEQARARLHAADLAAREFNAYQQWASAWELLDSAGPPAHARQTPIHELTHELPAYEFLIPDGPPLQPALEAAYRLAAGEDQRLTY